MTENRAGPHLSIPISSMYLPIMHLSFYLAISLSSIYLPLSPLIHPSIPRIYPLIFPVYQSAIHSSSTYLPIISILIYPFIYSSIPLIYPSRYPIYHPYLSIYLSISSISVSLIYFSASLSIHPPFHPLYLSMYLSCLSISYPLILYLPTYYLYSHLSFYLFIHPFFHSTHLSI